MKEPGGPQPPPRNIRPAGLTQAPARTLRRTPPAQSSEDGGAGGSSAGAAGVSSVGAISGLPRSDARTSQREQRQHHI